MAQADDKRAAAEAAVAEIQSGMLVGLGTGTTATEAIHAVARRVAQGLTIRAVATSKASYDLAQSLGIAMLDFAEVATVDLTIDGTDQIDPQLRAIKGAGGAMLREKIVASASTRMIVICDGTKRVEALSGIVPVEILPFAQAYAERALRELGSEPVLRLADGTTYRTDQDNPILDCRFAALPDPASTAAAIAAIPGALGHGLFVDQVDAAYIAADGVVTRLERGATKN